MNTIRSGAAIAAVSMVMAFGLGTSAMADAAKRYEIREFSAGPAWFVYDGPIDIGIHVLNPADPDCHELGEIILIFDTMDQLADEALIRTSALRGMERYAALCRSLGSIASGQRSVVGVIAGGAGPDARGRVIGDGRVLEGVVSSLTGEHQLRIRYNALADRAGSDSGANQVSAAETASTETATHRKRFDAMLAESSALTTTPGIVTRLAGERRAGLIGAWSGAPDDCANERLILIEQDGRGVIEWWRAPNDKVGLLPWRTGIWEIRDETLIASFNHRVEYDRLRRKLREGPIDETVQFELKEVKGTEIRLAAVGGGFSPGRLFLGGAEKSFIRCNR